MSLKSNKKSNFISSFTPKLVSRRNKVLKNTLDLSTTIQQKEEVKHKKISFLSIEKPDLASLEEMNKKYNFHPLAIEDCLSEFQRAKLEQYPDYLHLILQLPFYKADAIIPAEVSIFVSENYIVLIHWSDIQKLNNFIASINNSEEFKEEYMGKGVGHLLYKIVDILIDETFPLLDKIEKQERELEKVIFSDSYDDRKAVKEIAKVRRDIMTTKKIIKPQIAVINILERLKQKFMTDELELYFGDIVDNVNKQWDIISDQNEIIINLNYTNESLISVRTNNIMKTLTIISIIILPLTLLTGVYGMNIPLPMQEYKYAFHFIFVSMFGIVVTMLIFFKSKKWI